MTFFCLLALAPAAGGLFGAPGTFYISNICRATDHPYVASHSLLRITLECVSSSRALHGRTLWGDSRSRALRRSIWFYDARPGVVGWGSG